MKRATTRRPSQAARPRLVAKRESGTWPSMRRSKGASGEADTHHQFRERRNGLSVERDSSCE